MEPDDYDNKYVTLPTDKKDNSWKFYMPQDDYDQYMSVVDEFMRRHGFENNRFNEIPSPDNVIKTDVVAVSDSYDFFVRFKNCASPQRHTIIRNIKNGDTVSLSTNFWDKQFLIVEEMINQDKSFEDIEVRILMVCRITDLKMNFKK